MIKFEYTNADQVQRALVAVRKDLHKVAVECVNAQLLYIANDATMTTKKSTPEKIQQDVNDHKYAVVYGYLKKKGNKGLVKQDVFDTTLNKLLKVKILSIGYLRSGWLPAIRRLTTILNRTAMDMGFVKRYMPKMDKTVKQYGVEKGGMIYARVDQTYPNGSIWNNTGNGSPTAKKELHNGLKTSVTRVCQKMKLYFELRYTDYIKKNKLG